MIYVRAALDLIRSDIPTHGLAHITGGGLLNLLRLNAQRRLHDRGPAARPADHRARQGARRRLRGRGVGGLQHGLRLRRRRPRRPGRRGERAAGDPPPRARAASAPSPTRPAGSPSPRAGSAATPPDSTRSSLGLDERFRSSADLPIGVSMISRRLKIAVKDHRRTAAPFALPSAPRPRVRVGGVRRRPADRLRSPVPAVRGRARALRRDGDQDHPLPARRGRSEPQLRRLFAPDERVFANLVTSVGQAEYLRRIDYPAQVHTVGWIYSDLKPFRACEDVAARRVRPDPSQRRRLDHRLPARPQRRGLRAARRVPVPRHGPASRVDRGQRPVEGRRASRSSTPARPASSPRCRSPTWSWPARARTRTWRSPPASRRSCTAS